VAAVETEKEQTILKVNLRTQQLGNLKSDNVFPNPYLFPTKPTPVITWCAVGAVHRVTAFLFILCVALIQHIIFGLILKMSLYVRVPFCARKTTSVCLHFCGISFINETYLLSSLCYILTTGSRVSKDGKDSVSGNEFFSSPVYLVRICCAFSAYCRLSPDANCPNQLLTLSCNADVENAYSVVSTPPVRCVCARRLYFYLRIKKEHILNP
jgi:hypothetical protein